MSTDCSALTVDMGVDEARENGLPAEVNGGGVLEINACSCQPFFRVIERLDPDDQPSIGRDGDESVHDELACIGVEQLPGENLDVSGRHEHRLPLR